MSIALKVEVAWVADPYGTLTWTDISTYVTSMSTTRGRQYETDQNEAGTCKLELVNTDGRFDPTNTSSPYYPYVLPFRPVRVSAVVDGTAYPRFYGYTEKFIQTWPLGAWSNCELDCVDAFKATLGFSPGDPYDVKVQSDYDVFTGMAGASSSVWNFWAFDETAAPFAGDNGGSLAVSGDAVWKTVPSPCRTGVTLDGATQLTTASSGPGAGEVWFNPSALPAQGYMNELVVDQAGSSATTGASAWQSFDLPFGTTRPRFASALWTAVPNLMPSDNAAAFLTSVADWIAGAGVTISRSTAAAHEGLASMAFTIPAVAAGQTATIATGPACPVTAGQSYRASAWVQVSNTSTNMELGYAWYNSDGTLISTSSPVANGPTGSYTVNTWFRLSGPAQPAPAGATAMRVLLNTGAFGPTPTGTGYADSFQVIAGSSPSAMPAFTLPSQGSSSYLTVGIPNHTTTSLDIYDLPAPTTGQWHLLSWADGALTGGATFVALDGVAATLSRTVTGWATAYSTPATTRVGNGFQGTVAALWMQKSTNANVVIPSAAYALQHYSYGIAPGGQARTQDFPEELTGQRVADILTAIGWPTGMRDIDDGLSTMSASGSVVGKAGVGLIQDAATAELGNVFIAAGGDVTFRQRDDRNSRTSAVTFGDGSGETPYQVGLTVDFDDTHLANDIAVTQANSSPSYTYEAADLTSETTYGVRGMSVTAELADQADVQDMATTLLARYKDPLPRLEVLPFELRANPAIAADVLGREIGDMVTVKRRPAGAPEIDFGVFVDGISDTVDDNQWTVALQLTPQYPDTTY